MSSTLVPIFICVVLPIAVVLIICRTKMNSDNKRSEIIIKAIEANNGVETAKLIESLQKPKKSIQEIRNARLLRGCIYSLIGIALAVVGTANLLTGCEFSEDPVTVPFVFGGISMALGISYLIVYFVTRNQAETKD